MARRPLTYVENIQKRGIDGANDRFQKNGATFAKRIAEKRTELAQLQADCQADVEAYKIALGELANESLVEMVLNGVVDPEPEPELNLEPETELEPETVEIAGIK